ncbi:MAG: adenylate/guanylate cyclase [Verrucomicrobiales bacterium]|nr:adenylate/guanylate cyclase [Verrucomicrobiales bacterium]
MARKKFNPFDISAKEDANSAKEDTSYAPKAAPETSFLQVAVKPDLVQPIKLFLGRTEMFMERAKASHQPDILLEIKKIQAAAKYLLSLVHSSTILTDQRLEVELGHTAPSDTTLFYAVSHEDAVENMRGDCGTLLLVDDDRPLLEMLKLILEKQGHIVMLAENGEEALAALHTGDVDLILSDLTMPGINGYQLLEFIKADMNWRNIPVLILSGVRESMSAARCIELGADDYLPKPVNPPLLRARIASSLEKKRLRDLESAYLMQLQAEQEKSEKLLLNILPGPIAERLKKGESTIADNFPEATVLFADIVGFTQMAAQVSPAELVQTLNEIFSGFDRLVERFGLEKIKTIGDAYMVVGGLPNPRADHAFAVAEMAVEMQSELVRLNSKNGLHLRMRVGIHSGPVVAGVIGKKKFSYDLWGDTVNIASRMQSLAYIGSIQTSETTYELLKDKFTFTKRGGIEVKGKGRMTTYLLAAKDIDYSDFKSEIQESVEINPI